MRNSLQEGLSLAMQSTRVKASHTLPEVVNVELQEDCVRVTPVDNTTIGLRLKTSNVLFLELRRKIRELTKDPSWTVRYASKVNDPLLPFLHSSNNLKILVDPMSPYRNPIDALSKDGVLVLVLLPSHSYYFKPKEEVLSDGNTPKA